MVTLSSTEAEYIGLAEATQEAIYLCRILNDLNQQVVHNLRGQSKLYQDLTEWSTGQ